MTSSLPHFELKRVYEDGTESAPQIVPISEFPWSAQSDRRGFLGVGMAFATVMGVLGGSSQNASAAMSQSRRIKAHEKFVAGLAFSHDDTCLVSVSGDGTAKIWDFSSVNIR